MSQRHRNSIAAPWFVALTCTAFAGVSVCPARAHASAAELQASLEQANERFTQRDFQGALALLGPACAGSEQPACLFGLGAVHHALAHCEQAFDFYQRYRELEPHGEHAQEVQAALEQLQTQCGGARPSAGESLSTAPAAPVGRQTESPPTPLILASPFAQPSAVWEQEPAEPPGLAHGALIASLFGIAGGAAAGALTLGVLDLQLANSCAHEQGYSPKYHDLCVVKEPRYRSFTVGFGVAAGGFLAAGVALWWFDSRSNASLGTSLQGAPEIRYRRQF